MQEDPEGLEPKTGRARGGDPGSSRRAAPGGGQEPALSSHCILMSTLRGAAPPLPQSAGGARAQNTPHSRWRARTLKQVGLTPH